MNLRIKQRSTPVHSELKCLRKLFNPITLFDMGGGGGHDAPQNVFDHCAETLRKRKMKLGDF